VGKVKRLAIIGGGGWGTALACVLASRFDTVHLWVYEADLAHRMETERINDLFLPGVMLPPNVHASHSLEFALAGAEMVISVTPSHVVRSVYTAIAPWLEASTCLVSATKGLEQGTHLRMSQIIREETGNRFPVVVLSGPTFGRDVASGNPTAVVAASEDWEAVQRVQDAFSGPTFRVYGSSDPIGVEIGGALKNVIAIGAGISDGLGLGHNAVAALITRGLAELTRLAVALGARPETMTGLAGLGDLVLTCTGNLSRNRQLGIKLASGLSLKEILASTTTVAEGVRTTLVAMELARSCGVDLPITEEMEAVLYGGRSPQEAIRRLMTRSLRSELD
jgi:glycerol-3-phosphate dehydrogenase (NAD(P)+)